jgi:hypothetical protein
MENKLRDQLVKDLSAYYNEIGVNPYDFHCPHMDRCKSKVELQRGMECHIGFKYGEKKKILVSSMDCGNGGGDNIAGRTDSVYKKHDNPHMRGTLHCVRQLLDLSSPEEAVDYMAMTNACKCCRKEGEGVDHLSPRYYRECQEYKIAEYDLLKPDVILFQGERSLSFVGCEQYLKPTPIDYLYTYDDGKIKCFGIECIHPSARGKHYNRRKQFYGEIFPLIANYIKKEWANGS